jgi:hypothetical protein
LLLATKNEEGTVFHSAATFNIIEELQKIFNLGNKNLKTEEVKKFMLATDNEGRAVFHSATTLNEK